jgi:transposase
MIQITPQHRILLYPEHVDFRKGIDKMVGFSRAHIQHNPLCGALFCFRNRNMNAIKILVYDGTGFWLCHKRFSKGKIRYWPKSQEQANQVCAAELHALIHQGSINQLESSWHPLPSSKQ